MVDESKWPAGLRIRHVEPGDQEGFVKSMATPLAMGGTLQVPYTSVESWRERMSKIEPPGFCLVAESRSSAAPSGYEIVGNAGMFVTGSSVRRRHAMGIGMAVRDDWQGRGVGSALMSAMIDRADNWMNVLRLELTVYTDNAAAIALYQHFGFAIEGTHRAYALRAGALVDAYAMARLHPNPPRLPDSA